MTINIVSDCDGCTIALSGVRGSRCLGIPGSRRVQQGPGESRSTLDNLYTSTNLRLYMYNLLSSVCEYTMTLLLLMFNLFILFIRS